MLVLNIFNYTLGNLKFRDYVMPVLREQTIRSLINLISPRQF